MAKPNRRLAPTAEVNRCVIYVRVSTDGQAEDGVSLAMQEARCRQFAQSKGWDVVDVFVERGVSGSTDERPQLDALIREVQVAEEHSKPTATVVYSLSRLGRSVSHLHHLFEKLRVVSVSESWDMTTAAGQLIVSILSAVAEFEVNIIRERTASALAQVKAEGRRVGRPPFGWKMDGAGCLVKDDGPGGKWYVVNDMFYYAKDGRSKADIARVFDLHERQVSRILNDERNIREFERTNP
jgi:site-specific DNA recombinase